jgi:hypothetical protein
MKIIKKTNPIMSQFGNLKNGAVFDYQNEIYIKVAHRTSAVNLASGKPLDMHDCDDVILLDAELVVKLQGLEVETK